MYIRAYFLSIFRFQKPSHIFHSLWSLWKGFRFRPILAIMSAIPQDNEEAVEMAVDYEFDINTLPPNLRNIFPKKFVDTTKTPGKKLTKLKKGEQGLRVQTNETLQMSRCTFERDQEAVEYSKSISDDIFVAYCCLYRYLPIQLSPHPC